MFSFDKLTVKAQEAIQAAQEDIARPARSSARSEPLHLLAALVAQHDGIDAASACTAGHSSGKPGF